MHKSNNFDFLLSSVLAHTMMYEAKNSYSPNGVVDDAINMGGDPPAPTTNESMASILQAYQQHLPGLITTTSPLAIKANNDLELNNLNLSKQISPEYAKLQNELYQKYAPQLAKTGADVDSYTKTRNAETDADILQGAGKRLALTAKDIDQTLNPEFYKTREEQSKKFGELLNNINLNSPNIEAERLINAENVRSGNVMPSSTTAVANAISFGNENLKRQKALNDTLANATAFLQPSKTSFDPFGRNSTTSGGQGSFTGVTQVGNTGYNSANQLGNNLLNTTGQMQATSMGINANRRDSLDRFNETMGSMPSVSC